MNCEFLFTSCKVILRVANLFCTLEIKLRVASCFLRAANLRKGFFELQVALRIENLKKNFYELPVAFHKLKVKMMFTSCEVAFYKLNSFDADFTNYHHMVESDFKGINLRKLWLF